MQKGHKESKPANVTLNFLVSHNIKVFSQCLTWRNGRDTAYNLKMLGQRLTNKLRVIKMFERLNSQSISQNQNPNDASSFRKKIDQSKRASELLRMKKDQSKHSAEPATRNTISNIVGWRLEAYQMRLTALLLEHQSFIKTLINKTDYPILIESGLKRDFGPSAHRILLQLLGAIQPDHQYACLHTHGLQGQPDAALSVLANP